jgi:hypothetical protein
MQNKNYYISLFIELSFGTYTSDIIQYNKKYTNIYKCDLTEEFINQSYTNHDNSLLNLKRFKLTTSNSSDIIIPDDIYLYNNTTLWLYFNIKQNTITSIISIPNLLDIQYIINTPIINNNINTNNTNIKTTIETKEINDNSIILNITLLTFTQDIDDKGLECINSITNSSTILKNDNGYIDIINGTYYISNYLCYINTINYFPHIFDKNNNKIIDSSNCTLYVYSYNNIQLINSLSDPKLIKLLTPSILETNISITNLYTNYNIQKPNVYGDLNLVNINKLSGILNYNSVSTQLNSILSSSTIYYGYTIVLYGKINFKVNMTNMPNVIINTELSTLGILITAITSIYYDNINNKLTIYSTNNYQISKPTKVNIIYNNSLFTYKIISLFTYKKYKYILSQSLINNYQSYLLINNSETFITLQKSNNTEFLYLDNILETQSTVINGYNLSNNYFIDYLNLTNINNSFSINNFNIVQYNNNWLITIGQYPSNFKIDSNTTYIISYNDIIIDNNIDNKNIKQKFLINLIKNIDGTLSFISSIYINQLCSLTLTRYSYDFTQIYDRYIIKYNGYLSDNVYKIALKNINNSTYTYSITPIPLNINQTMIYFISNNNDYNQITFINSVHDNDNNIANDTILFTSNQKINITSSLIITSYLIQNNKIIQPEEYIKLQIKYKNNHVFFFKYESFIT